MAQPPVLSTFSPHLKKKSDLLFPVQKRGTVWLFQWVLHAFFVLNFLYSLASTALRVFCQLILQFPATCTSGRPPPYRSTLSFQTTLVTSPAKPVIWCSRIFSFCNRGHLDVSFALPAFSSCHRYSLSLLLTGCSAPSDVMELSPLCLLGIHTMLTAQIIFQFLATATCQ